MRLTNPPQTVNNFLLMPMKKKELKRFKELLGEGRVELTKITDATKERATMVVSPDDLADEVDLASTESDQSMSLRLRDRERILLHKIDKALEKIEDGTYGVCEQCGEDIGAKRLEARPVTDLCIRCKEEQERMEKSYATE